MTLLVLLSCTWYFVSKTAIMKDYLLKAAQENGFLLVYKWKLFSFNVLVCGREAEKRALGGGLVVWFCKCTLEVLG